MRPRGWLGATARTVALLSLCCDPDESHLQFALLSPDGNAEYVRATTFVSPSTRADVDADGVDELLAVGSGSISFTRASGESADLLAWQGARELRWIDLVGDQAELLFLDDADRLVAVRCEQPGSSPACDVERSVPAPGAEEFAVADFDEDGLLDAVALTSEHEFQFLYGLVEAERAVAESAGEEWGSTRWATEPRAQLAVGDLDEDGHDDIVELGRELKVLFGDGQGSFPVTKTVQLPATRYVRRVALAKLGDGRVHIITDQAVFVNLGGRELDDGSSTPYGGNDLFAVGDFLPEDGAEVLVHPRASDSVSQPAIVSRAVDGSWSLRPITLELEPAVLSVVVADLDGDGTDDLAISSGSSPAGGCE